VAFNKINNVVFKGVAACVPKNVYFNKDYPLFSEAEYEKFASNVGIRERRVVENGMCTSDLCFEAGLQLIEKLNWEKNSIDLLVFVSHTPDYKLPATSCILQDRLGLSNNCMTLDISLGCSGYAHGLNVASSMLQSGHFKRALLLVGNTQTSYASFYDKSVFPLFADAGTATALEYGTDGEPMYFNMGTDGSGFKSIIVEDGGCRNPVNFDSFTLEELPDGNKSSRLHERLDGMDVFTFGIRIAPQTIKELSTYFNLDISSTDYFLFHQANKMMLEKVKSKLKLDSNKVPINIDRFGNTSCATIPLLMVTELKKELEERKLDLILSAFGVGLSWGALKLSTNNLKVVDLIEI